MMIRSVLF